ncbi:MAG: D-alanyl-D-alanine carboxypeptidase [Solirubrobacterales bacterium]|nr:D-alanyl-D-alanine carboxypeptidase [Solirubrobacterales bacterium]
MSRGRGRCLVAAICAAVVILSISAPALARAGPALSVRAAALIDERTGQPLYLKAASSELPIASTTKLMTALLTLEEVPRLTRIFTQNDYYPAAADSQIGLVPGERMSVHDLLLALLLPSADDAAEDLAYNVGGRSVDRFVAMMNARARELGLAHTHYATPSGLDTPGNYSSASDLVTLARYELQHEPFFRRVVALRSATLRTGRYVRHVSNRNTLLGRVPWVNGVKTGHTSDAGYVLVGAGTRDGMTLVSAVLGTSSEATRDSNTLALLGYGFASFHLVHPVQAGEVLARPSVRDDPGRHAIAIAARGFAAVTTRDARVHVQVEVPAQLAGPQKRYTVVGTALVSADGHALGRIRLVLAQALPAVSPLTQVGRFIMRPFTLVPLALMLAAAAAVIVRRRARMRGGRMARRKPA